MMLLRALGAVLALAWIMPSAAADVTIGPGVTIESPNVALAFVENTTTLDEGVTFESTTGPPILDSFTIDFQPTTGASWSWDVLRFDLPTLFSFRGNNSASGRLEVEGLNGEYDVRGVLGFPTFQVNAPYHNFSIPTGNQTIEMEVAGGGPVELSTAFDEWIPILIWLILTIFFLTRRPPAYVPAVAASLMVVVVQFATPWISTFGGTMLILATLMVHVLSHYGLFDRMKGDTSR